MSTHPGAFDPTLFGYAETTEGRGLVAGAIGKVNNIVDATDGLQLVPGWEKASWTKDSIPVHLIRGTSSTMMIFVPRGCRCVVIGVPALLAWLDSVSDAQKADMNVDHADALAFMMLHELGHIVHGDNEGDAFTPLPTRVSDTNLVSTAEKTREFAADAWAARLGQARSHARAPGLFCVGECSNRAQ